MDKLTARKRMRYGKGLTISKALLMLTPRTYGQSKVNKSLSKVECRLDLLDSMNMLIDDGKPVTYNLTADPDHLATGINILIDFA